MEQLKTGFHLRKKKKKTQEKIIEKSDIIYIIAIASNSQTWGQYTDIYILYKYCQFIPSVTLGSETTTGLPALPAQKFLLLQIH